MKTKNRLYRKPGFFSYTLARIASFFVSSFVFRRRFLRNELKDVRGPCVVIANHQAALDFVNLIGASRRRMSFVISNSFYRSLPLRKIMDRMGVIPKQQFKTSVNDMKKMKAVIDNGEILVIYPAGLMCEDGLSTPIPAATYKFLKWLNADVYMARTEGSYFVMPKWTRGFRPGRTYMDVYRLFDKETLASMDPAGIRERADPALLFDAYREQEDLRVRYAHNDDIRGWITCCISVRDAAGNSPWRSQVQVPSAAGSAAMKKPPMSWGSSMPQTGSNRSCATRATGAHGSSS